ncbi:MAG TPA: DUF58 domain-containing protein [Blastocatellia bacterium]|nr:DUF58 domain-containing protein [Blastocatellia bacterium]
MSGKFRDLLSRLQSLSQSTHKPKYLRNLRNAILSIILVIVALVAAIGSAVLSRSNYLLSAALAGFALLLSLIISVTIVPRLAKRARFELFSWKIFSQITTAGWLYLTITAIVGLAALNSANNLLYLIFSVLVGLLFASSIIARNSLRDLVVKLRLPDHIFAGEPILVSVAVENQKMLLPSFSVLVEANTTNDSTANDEPKKTGLPGGPLSIAYFPFIPRGSALRQHTRHTFEQRGYYKFHGFTLMTKFPIGFFKKSREVDAEGELVVYPKTQPISDFFHLLPINDGQFASRLKGSNGTDLYAIRQYEPSDVVRRIDWKATAKMSRLMVKDFTREDEWRINLVFDSSQVEKADYDFAAKFEKGITLAASLTNHFIKEGAEVQLIIPGETVSYGSGRDHLFRVLQKLAMLQPSTKEITKSDKSNSDETAWWLFDEMPSLVRDRHFKILITSAERGSIPASLWRSAHIVYLKDL